MSGAQRRTLLRSLVEKEMASRPGCSYDEAFGTVAALRPELTASRYAPGLAATTHERPPVTLANTMEDRTRFGRVEFLNAGGSSWSSSSARGDGYRDKNPTPSATSKTAERRQVNTERRAENGNQSLRQSEFLGKVFDYIKRLNLDPILDYPKAFNVIAKQFPELLGDSNVRLSGRGQQMNFDRISGPRAPGANSYVGRPGMDNDGQLERMANYARWGVRGPNHEHIEDTSGRSIDAVGGEPLDAAS